MARIVRLTPRYLRQLRSCAVAPGSAMARDASATVRALAAASSLPMAGDARALMPPTSEAFVRRVRGRNLWIWYHATDVELIVVTATAAPPVPVDE